jgi:hypothetical protein
MVKASVPVGNLPDGTDVPAVEAATEMVGTQSARLDAIDDGSQPEPARKKRKARIEHKVPGRIRMKIPSAKNNPEILEVYKDAFSAIPGISFVNTKPATGSIVIHYDATRDAEFHRHLDTCFARQQMVVTTGRPGDEIDQMARKIQAEAEFLAEHSQLAKTTVEFCKKVDRELKMLSGNTIDLKITLAVGVAAYTFLEIGAGAATPMWVTIGLFAVNEFAERSSDHARSAASTADTTARR